VQEKDQGTEVVIEDRGDATCPTEVKVTYEDGETMIRRIDVKHWLAGKRTATLKLGPGVKKIVIDPRRLTIDINRRNNSWNGDGD
jgi:hypothetical protein